jgi:zinc protease
MKKYIFQLIFICITIGLVNAQVDRSKAPVPGPAPTIQIGNYTKFELPNGLKVFVVENHRIPRVSYSISFIFSPELEGAQTGIGSLTAQLIGTGTKTRTKDQINEEIDFIGGSLNASSEGIYASSLRKHTEKVLDLLSDVAMNSQFNKEELEKKRTQTLSSIASNKDDANAISNNVSSALFFGKDHPYGEFATEATIKSISLEMCTQYYQNYFKPNIAYLSIVGDITPAEAKKLIEQYFGKWQKGEVKQKTYVKPQPPSSVKVAIVDRPQSVQSVIVVGYPVDLNRASPDYFKVRVANTILGGGIFRLFLNLREKHAYTYGAYSSITFNPLVAGFEATASVRNAVTDSSIHEILYEMKRIGEEKVSESELTMAKNYLTGNFALSLESPQTIASFAINTERYNLPKDFYSNYLKMIEAVTIADVQDVSKKYIQPDRSIILVVGKASEIAEKLKKFSPQGKIDYYDINANIYDPTTSSKSIPAGVTAQSVIKKYVEVIGGVSNIQKVKDISMKGKLSVSGMNIDMKMLYLLPDKFISEVSMNGQVMQKQVLNGQAGHSSGMQGNKDLKGEELEQLKQSATPFIEADYEKLLYKTVLKEITTIDGKDAFKIEITSPENMVSTDYYSVETGLKIRSESTMDVGQSGKMTMVTDFLEYSDIQGVKYPTKMKQSMGPQVVNITIDEILVNSGIKEDIFK